MNVAMLGQEFSDDPASAAAPDRDPAALPAIKLLDFATNNANYLKLEMEASAPATVEYLLWNNPRLHYYLNGKPVDVIDSDGLQTTNIPSGRSTVEVRYRHWLLTLFWVVYGAFGIALVWALVIATGARRRAWRQARQEGIDRHDSRPDR